MNALRLLICFVIVPSFLAAQPCIPLESESFELDFGSWVDGGLYCDRSSNASCDGAFSIRLRSDTDPWSTLTSPSFDMTGFDSLYISFEARADNTSGSLLLQISHNGAPFSTVINQGFTKANNCTETTAFLFSNAFGPNTRIRFFSQVALSERIFVDNVIISRCGGLAEQCFDGMKNGDESGIDCGGSLCELCECDGVSTSLNMITTDTIAHYGQSIDTQSGGSISNGANVFYTAGDSVLIKPNFEISLGVMATFRIENCQN